MKLPTWWPFVTKNTLETKLSEASLIANNKIASYRVSIDKETEEERVRLRLLIERLMKLYVRRDQGIVGRQFYVTTSISEEMMQQFMYPPDKGLLECLAKQLAQQLAYELKTINFARVGEYAQLWPKKEPPPTVGLAGLNLSGTPDDDPIRVAHV